VRDVRLLTGVDIGIHALGAVPSRLQAFDAIEQDGPLAFLRARFVPGSRLYADEHGIVICSEQQPPA
jgi:regulator of RNase E activity RraA